MPVSNSDLPVAIWDEKNRKWILPTPTATERAALEKERANEKVREQLDKEKREEAELDRTKNSWTGIFDATVVAVSSTVVSAESWAKNAPDSILAWFKGISPSTPPQPLEADRSVAPTPGSQKEPTQPQAPQVIPSAKPAPSSSNEIGRTVGSFFNDAAASNEAGIESVLWVAESGDKSQIETAAIDAGRGFYFAGINISRDRKRARILNEQALAASNRGDTSTDVYKLQLEALQADPLDIEVAGNLAIYALRSGHTSDANKLAFYALSLPRANGKTGRTADWATLAATYAELGEHRKATAALYVTLGIAPDIAKRCYSAIYSVKHTYGPALKQATESMFARIRDQGLSYAGECAMPIEW
jgi:hypothetical protein